MSNKLEKYIRKLNTSTDETKNAVYLQKISQYINSTNGFNHTGGSSMSIHRDLENLVKNNYKIISNSTQLKQAILNANPKDVGIVKGLNPPEGEGKIPFGNDLSITVLQDNYDPKYNLSQITYKFKKSFSLDMTDDFVTKVLTDEDFNKMANYVFFAIQLSLDVYIELCIKKQIFGPHTNLICQNIHLLYKGGNTTRLLIDCLYKSIPDKCVSAKEKIDAFLKESARGDWDYSIKIDYDKIETGGYKDKRKLKEIVDQIMGVMALCTIYVKPRIIRYLYSTAISNKTEEELRKRFFPSGVLDPNNGNDIRNKINKFINEYNTELSRMPPSDIKKIENIEVAKILTWDTLMTQAESKHFLVATDATQPTQYNTLLFTDSKKQQHKKNFTKYVIKADRLLIDENNSKYLDNVHDTSHVKIVYLENLRFLRRYNWSDFGLIRVKIANEMVYDIKYDNDPVQVQGDIHANVDIIDISILYPTDVRRFFKQFMYDNAHDHVTCQLIHKKTLDIEKKDTSLEITIPSAEYMFNDIALMLFDDNIYAWEDLKYFKRIRRLLYLSLVCLYDAHSKLPLQDIKNMVDKYIALFRELENMGNIDDKLNKLAGHYSISNWKHSEYIKKSIQIITDPSIVVTSLDIVTGSLYKFDYFEYILGNYIRMLITSKYIIHNDVVDPMQVQLCKYMLEIHKAVVDNAALIPKNISPITTTIEKVYMDIRGTPYNVNPNIMGPAAPAAVTHHLEDYKKYEGIIIKYFTDIQNITQDLIANNVSMKSRQMKFTIGKLY